MYAFMYPFKYCILPYVCIITIFEWNKVFDFDFDFDFDSLPDFD